MMRPSCAALCVLVGVLPASANTLIVESGQPRATIVTAAEPSENAARAAKELQRFIARMSGCTLPIQSLPARGLAPGTARLLVGHSPVVAALNVDVPTGYHYDVNDEGFVLETVGPDIIIAGNDDGPYHGTLYAAYEFLERLGCRWYFPGEFGQVTPQRRTIRIPPLHVRSRPSFAIRNIWRAGWADLTDGYDEWATRNKMTATGLFAFPGDGSIRTLAPPDKYFEKHPEIYALSPQGERYARGSFGIHGQTAETMLCLTNPLTVRIAADTIREHFRAHPEANSYGFSPPDGAPRCFCDDCEAANHGFENESGARPSVSDVYYNFVNRVAARVAETFPDRYLVTLAYSNRVRPPEALDEPLRDNVIIQIARLDACTIHALDSATCPFAQRYFETVKAWARICPRLLIYDYDPQTDLSRMPFWNVHAIRRNLPLYHRNHVVGFTTEGHNTFLRTGLNYYVRAKLMWDVHADVDGLLDDFYLRFFGSAAVPMRRFIEAIEGATDRSEAHMRWTSGVWDWADVFDPDRTLALSAQLDRAAHLADSAEIKSRIAAYRTVHQYMVAHLGIIAAQRAGQFTEALAAVDRLVLPLRAAEAIQPGLFPPDGEYVQSRERGIETLRRQLRPLAARDGGTLGRRVALAPASARFRTDPHNQGLFQQWPRRAVAESLAWDTVSLHRDWTLNGYRDTAGHGYAGYAWYQFAVDVPAEYGDRPIKLYVPRVYGERFWMWANGRLVHSPSHTSARSNMDIDVTRALRAGRENTFTFRVHAAEESLQRGGLAGRPLLWSPH